MQFIKIFSLSTFLFLANCSFIGDKVFKSDKDEEESKEQEIVLERVYIEDENLEKDIKREAEKKSSKGDFLAGDIENEEDYPNLANVPQRPDPAISIDEQKQIIKDLKNENVANLEPIKSFPVEKDSLSEPVEEELNTFNKNNLNSEESIRSILNQRLVEQKSYKPKNLNKTPEPGSLDEQEEELHKMARSLKDVKSQEEVIKLEKKIQKNDLYYSPKDVEDILGLPGLDNKSSRNIQKKEIKPKKTTKTEIVKSDKTDLSVIKGLSQREVPIARISFLHGSANLKDQDLEKIQSIVKLFNENEGKKLIIVGHSSSRTSYDMDLTKHALTNFNMSLKRATNVMNKFSTAGIISEKMELVAMSDAEPLYAEIMPKLEAANRRAEIFIQY